MQHCAVREDPLRRQCDHGKEILDCRKISPESSSSFLPSSHEIRLTIRDRRQKEVEIAEAKQRYQAAREALAQIDRSQTDIAGQKKLAEVLPSLRFCGNVKLKKRVVG